ncbi:putative reverse transcriptase domain-containing protein [Tanacetum coccineum]
MPPEDEVLPAKDQPLSAAVSPTTDSPCYVLELDLEEDPKEDDDEDPEEDPADYPTDGGYDGDDEDESSDDDEDDDVDIEGDEEEEEHPAPSDSTAVALPAVDHASFAEETKPFETDKSAATPPPHPAYSITARISIQDKPPTQFWSDTEVARLLDIPTPPPSPLSPWSSKLPQIPSPPLPLILSLLPISSPPPASPTYPLRYRAAMIRLRAEAPSTFHSPLPHIILSHTRADTPPSRTPPLLPIPLPTSSPYLLLPSAGADRLKVCLPPGKRLCFAFGPMYEVGESSSAAAARPTGGFRADYGFVATMDREIRHDLERDVSYGITNTWDEMLVDMLGVMIDQGITVALATRDADRNTNGDDRHNSGTSVRRTERTAHEFENQVKFATCNLYSVALTWWNTHVKTVGHDAAYGMPWKTVRKIMTDKYCPRNEIKKLEMEIWDLKVKGTDLTSYTQHFQELALLCGRMFPEESDKIEKYVGGLPDLINGSVVASKPKTMQDADEITTELMDKKIHTFVERQTESKKEFEDTSRNIQNQQQQQQQQNKRQNTGRAYTVGTGALQTPTMLTIKEALGRVRSQLVISVETKGISRGIV